MTTLNQRIAKNVRAARKALGLTQQQLAAAAEVAIVTVARLEQGRTAHPRGLEFDRIAAALGRSADDLYGLPDEADEPAPSPAPLAEMPDFRAQLEERYGPENAEFIDAVVSTIKGFPPKEADFVRYMLLRTVRGLHNPRQNRSDGGSPLADLAHIR